MNQTAEQQRDNATTEPRVLDTVGAVVERIAGFSGSSLTIRDARELIAAVLDVPRHWPVVHAERALTPDEVIAIDVAVRRFSKGMPLAYAARRAAFRAITLDVDERVLIPRPETEVLVDLVLEMTGGGAGTAIDVGTGSGCIAISLALEGRFDRVIAIDVSPDAIAVAEDNARRLVPDARIEFHTGNMLESYSGNRADVIVSNPPYIAFSEMGDLPALVRDWEPRIALFAEDDGMAAIDAIAAQSPAVLRDGGLLALEVDSRRAERAAELVAARSEFCDVLVKPDLTGRARFVLARRVEA